MILDIGASESACRGDVCLIYAFDRATERHLSQYDSLWPLKGGRRLYYGNTDELVRLIEEHANVDTVSILVHSLEHMDCPYAVLRTLAEVRVREVHVYVPNARTNDADWKDPTHVYSETTTWC